MSEIFTFHSDCVPIMNKLNDKSIDLIITDPPYGVNFKSNNLYDVSLWYIKNNVNLWCKEWFRLLKDSCFIALFNLYVLFSVSASERLIREMNVRQLSENIEHANNEGYIDQLFFVHQSGQDIIYVDLDSDNQDRFYKICKMGRQWYLAPADKDFDLQNENTIPIQLKLGLLKDTDYIKVFTSADMFEADSKEKQSYTILYNEYE